MKVKKKKKKNNLVGIVKRKTEKWKLPKQNSVKKILKNENSLKGVL